MDENNIAHITFYPPQGISQDGTSRLLCRISRGDTLPTFLSFLNVNPHI